MPIQLIVDDGYSVTLDLHGETVERAEGIFLRTLELAHERHRNSVRVVHGSSTSIGASARTIKNRIRKRLDEGSLPVPTHGVLHLEGETIVALGVTGNPDPRLISAFDVVD